MKKIYEGILFVVFLAVAILGTGAAEANDKASFPLLIIAVAIAYLMYRSGMMAKIKE
jgi:hypothetical protein